MKFFDDDGTEINPNLFSKPALCLSCKKNSLPEEEVFCNLTRLDQIGEDEFRCFAYENISGQSIGWGIYGMLPMV